MVESAGDKGEIDDGGSIGSVTPKETPGEGDESDKKKKKKDKKDKKDKKKKKEKERSRSKSKKSSKSNKNDEDGKSQKSGKSTEQEGGYREQSSPSKQERTALKSAFKQNK